VTLNHRVWVAGGDKIADLLTVIISFPVGGLSFIYDLTTPAEWKQVLEDKGTT
jgi:hypothetical protein